MKRAFTVLAAVLVLMLGTGALADVYHISDENEMNFGRLCIVLIRACESPTPGDADAVQSVLDAIGAMDAGDRVVAEAIAQHWMEGSALPDSPTHAFEVLGFKLKNGEMTEELALRCEAAAAAARSFPHAILVCSGGATGSNNPKKHTEAGLMKAYLTEKCGIDASRIFIDEQARSTVENAENTFRILQAQGVQSYTVVTSAYHQKWGQVIYNAMAAFYRQTYGYDTQILENYSCNITYNEEYPNDARWAVYQLAVMLDLPDEVMEAIKRSI